MRTAFIVSALATSLTGCATIETSGLPFQSNPSPRVVPAGFAYHLPIAEVMPDAFMTLAVCGTDDKILSKIRDQDGKPLEPPLSGISFAVDGKLASEVVGGPRIVIDYRKLGQFLKTGSLAIERYPNGTLKSINASIADETPEIIASVAAAVGSAYLMTINPAAAVPLIGSMGIALEKDKLNQKGFSFLANNPNAKTITYPVCSPKTVADMAKRAAAKTIRDADVDKLKVQTAALAELLAEAGTVFTPDQRRSINTFRGTLNSLTASIAAQTKTIDEINEALTLRLTTNDGAPPAIEDFISELTLTSTPSTDSMALELFVKRHFVVKAVLVEDAVADQFDRRKCTPDDPDQPDQHCKSVAEIKAFIEKASQVTVKATPTTRMVDAPQADASNAIKTEAAKLLPADCSGKLHRLTNAPRLDSRCAATDIPTYPDQLARGLVRAGESIIYVEPAPYRFVLTAPKLGRQGSTQRKTLDAKVIDVPQKGTYLGLPLRAEIGVKVELTAAFNEAGTLLSATYKRPQSGGKATADMLKSIAATAVDARDKGEARRAKLIADAEARRLALITGDAAIINGEIAVIDAKAKRNSLLDPKPPTIDPDADVKTRLATATANALLEEAYLRIAVAQQGPPPR